MTRKIIVLLVLAAFGVSSVQMPVFAQIDPVPFMPVPGTMVPLSPAFTPAYLKGIVIHPKDPFKFDFIIYKGDRPLSEAHKREEYTKLTKYFLASLAIPDNDQWVNLSPYEKDRIIKDNFGKTEMGRDLLAQDYLLKQITASLIYPESRLGQEFWKKVYAQAQKQYGTTDIPVNTFNKVWILPDDALIYEKGNAAYVLKNHLRVMLEEDYLSLQKHTGIKMVTGSNSDSRRVQRQELEPVTILHQIVLPELEREVNEDANFAPLRQVYSGMLLATWFKRELKQSLLAQIYANKAKVKGVDQDPKTNEEIYQRYLEAYKKGVFNFIKDDADTLTNENMPRKYFSGGLVSYAMMTQLAGKDVEITHDAAMVSQALVRDERMDDVANFAMVENNQHPTFTRGETDHSSDAVMTAEEALEKFRTRPNRENLGIREQIIKPSDMESVTLAQQRLEGLVSHFILVDYNGHRVILQEKLRSLRNVVQEKMDREDFSGAKALLVQIFDLNLRLFKRGVIYRDFSYDSFAVRSSGTVVITDMRGFKEFYNRQNIRNLDAYIKQMGASLRKNVPAEVLDMLLEIGIKRRFFRYVPYTLHFARPYLPIILDVREIKKRIRSSLLHVQGLDAAMVISQMETDTYILRHNGQQQSIHSERTLPNDVWRVLMQDVKEKMGPSGEALAEQFVQEHNIAGTAWQRATFALVVRELVTNAVEAMQGVSRKKLGVELAINGDQLIITIRDNGKGLEKDQPRIFEEGFTTKRNSPSNGLGLAYIKKYLDQVWPGSTIEAFDNLPESGATFRVTLPVPVDAAMQADAKAKPDRKAGIAEARDFPLWLKSRDNAMNAVMRTPGGIDLNSANLNLRIKRDGAGMPLPLSQQDLAQLGDFQGLDPVILSIKPASQMALFAELTAH